MGFLTDGEAIKIGNMLLSATTTGVVPSNYDFSREMNPGGWINDDNIFYRDNLFVETDNSEINFCEISSGRDPKHSDSNTFFLINVEGGFTSYEKQLEKYVHDAEEYLNTVIVGMNLRKVGMSFGIPFSENHLVSDVLAVANFYMQKRSISVDRLIFTGEGLGSAIAAMACEKLKGSYYFGINTMPPVDIVFKNNSWFKSRFFGAVDAGSAYLQIPEKNRFMGIDCSEGIKNGFKIFQDNDRTFNYDKRSDPSPTFYGYQLVENMVPKSIENVGISGMIMPAQVFYPFNENRKMFSAKKINGVYVSDDNFVENDWFDPVRINFCQVVYEQDDVKDPFSIDKNRKIIIRLEGMGNPYETRVKQSYIPLAKELPGIIIAGMNFRNVWQSKSRPPTSETDWVEDVKMVFKYFIKKGADPKNILIHGESLGGAIGALSVAHLSKKYDGIKFFADRTFSTFPEVVTQSILGGWVHFLTSPIVSGICSFMDFEINVVSAIKSLKPENYCFFNVDNDPVINQDFSLYSALGDKGHLLTYPRDSPDFEIRKAHTITFDKLITYNGTQTGMDIYKELIKKFFYTD